MGFREWVGQECSVSCRKGPEGNSGAREVVRIPLDTPKNSRRRKQKGVRFISPMTKLHILQEIKRTTQANGGKPLRKIEFESATGITRHDWFGVYWARWSDALREATCVHNHADVESHLSRPPRYDRSHSSQSLR